MMKRLALTLALAASFAAQAQELIVATGNLKTGTYSQMFTELSRFCQPSTIGIMIKQRETSGSVENVALLTSNKVNAAIVQSDLLFAARAADESSVANIKTLFGLHQEEVHFIARSDTKKEGGWLGGRIGGTTVSYNTLSDLTGRAVGAVGGSKLSAQVISQYAGLNLEVRDYANNDALKTALVNREVDAIVVVGGAPHALVGSLSRDFRLLPLGQDTQLKLKDIYAPTKVSYDNLGQNGVSTVSTQALFVTRTYSGQAMLGTLSKLRKCEKENIDNLKDALGTHAKWQQVTAANDGKWPIYDLPR